MNAISFYVIHNLDNKMITLWMGIMCALVNLYMENIPTRRVLAFNVFICACLCSGIIVCWAYIGKYTHIIWNSVCVYDVKYGLSLEFSVGVVVANNLCAAHNKTYIWCWEVILKYCIVIVTRKYVKLNLHWYFMRFMIS